MGRGQRDRLTTLAIIQTAIPHHAAKVLTRALGCTDRQGKRIASGKVPGRYKAALAALLTDALTLNKKLIESALDDLKAHDYAAMVARSQDRLSQSDRTSPAISERQAHRK